MDKVEIFEKERAAGYDQFVETWIPNYHYFLDRLPKLLSEAEQKDLLVVGCGTGNEMAGFIQAPEQWEITGTDPSPEMIKQARQRFENDSNIVLIDGFLADISLKKKFGAATLLLVLHFLEDNGNKLALLKDISKALRPGAIFVLLDITGNKDQIRGNLNVLRLLLPDHLDKEQIDNRLNRIEQEHFLVSEERLSELCTEAGFGPPLRFFQSAIYSGWLIKKK